MVVIANVVAAFGVFSQVLEILSHLEHNSIIESWDINLKQHIKCFQCLVQCLAIPSVHSNTLTCSTPSRSHAYCPLCLCMPPFHRGGWASKQAHFYPNFPLLPYHAMQTPMGHISSV